MTVIKNMAYWKAKNGLSSPAKQGVIMSDEKKYGTIEEQAARNRAFAAKRAQFEKMGKEGTAEAMQQLGQQKMMKKKKGKVTKEDSPGKWVQFIPMALSALGAMKKDK